MMVGYVKTVLVLRWHFLPNNLTSAGKLCKLVPLSTILCTPINFQFVLLAVSQLPLGDIGCQFQSNFWAL